MNAAALDTKRLLVDATFALAEGDPHAAARTLARGIRHQTAGAKVSVAAALIRALEQDAPGVTAAVLRDLAR
jgi:hypothetical protein